MIFLLKISHGKFYQINRKVDSAPQAAFNEPKHGQIRTDSTEIVLSAVILDAICKNLKGK